MITTLAAAPLFFNIITHKIVNLDTEDVTLKEIRLLDVHGTGGGTIGFEELFRIITHEILNRGTEDEILKAFRLSDDHETGCGTIGF